MEPRWWPGGGEVTRATGVVYPVNTWRVYVRHGVAWAPIGGLPTEDAAVDLARTTLTRRSQMAYGATMVEYMDGSGHIVTKRYFTVAWHGPRKDRRPLAVERKDGIHGQMLDYDERLAEDEDMTTTKRCYVCETRRPGPDVDAKNIGLCNRCYDESSLENEHSDYGHAEPVVGCPSCGLSSLDADKAPRTITAGPKAASTVSKDGTKVCATCKAEKPVTKFPTKHTKDGVIREDRCRQCRDANQGRVA